jgi:hypothetical protein
MPGGYGEAEWDAGIVPIMSCSSDPGGGHVEAGAAPRHHPAGDAPGGSAGDHPPPSRHQPHRRAHGLGEDVPLSRGARHLIATSTVDGDDAEAILGRCH